VQSLLGKHGVNLVGGHPVSQNRIEIERCADRVRGRGAVSGNHDHAGDAGLAQHSDRAWRIGAKLIGE